MHVIDSPILPHKMRRRIFSSENTLKSLDYAEKQGQKYATQTHTLERECTKNTDQEWDDKRKGKRKSDSNAKTNTENHKWQKHIIKIFHHSTQTMHQDENLAHE